MKIAVLSDTHSRYHTVETVLQQLQARNINTIIHCGDIEDSETVWLFQGFTTHFVFGNCDTERASLQQAIYGVGASLHEPFGHLELNGVKIGFVHGDDHDLLRELENSGHFDFLFSGHTHVAKEHRAGSTRVINPGALHRARQKSYLVLDLDTQEIEPVLLRS
jgi:putative phosphoesterase